MLGNALRSILLLLCLTTFVPQAHAVAVDEPLSDPQLEARARAIHKELRCLVCQNQSIEDSNAPLARDLRILVRERIASGDSDEAAIRYIVDRYGDWVLLQPPVKIGTIILWAAPAVFLLLAVILVAMWYRRRNAPVLVSAAPLSSDEESRLKDLLQDRDRG